MFSACAEDAPCALYALEVTDEAYVRARRRAEHMMARGELYRFNTLGLILCALHIRWQRRRHYFCSQFVSEVLEKSGAMELPKDSTLMHPNDYAQLPQLKLSVRGMPGRPAPAPEPWSWSGERTTVVSVLSGADAGSVRKCSGVRKIF